MHMNFWHNHAHLMQVGPHWFVAKILASQKLTKKLANILVRYINGRCEILVTNQTVAKENWAKNFWHAKLLAANQSDS